MKNIIFQSLLLLSLVVLWSCKKSNYPGARVSPYIAVYDVKNLYKGKDVTLTTGNMFGSTKLAVMVVSDHSGNNLPAGLLVVQDGRRLGQLRGISIPIGEDASAYVPGDSVLIDIEGGVLTRKDGILQITGIAKSRITKVSSGNSIPLVRVPSSYILADPNKYESVLSVIVKGGFNPLPAPGEVLSGDKLLNDGFGDIILHTDPNATFANTPAPVSANYYGISFNTPAGDSVLPRFHIRIPDDIVTLSSVIEIPPVIITGFMSDVKGGDGNYEYVQMMATTTINFATTPFAVVVTNNANASVPTGYPAQGWATGQMRTFKFNLFSGSVNKGEFFYVGGTGKQINGSGSTSMSGSKWIRSFNYTTTGGDGFGTKTGGLFANSGNASGVAVFADSNVTVNTKPVDVIWIGSSGSLFTSGPPAQGYRIANTDLYDIKNPITLEDQPFYRQGSNTINFPYSTADVGYFNILGGAYNMKLGKWVKARNQVAKELTKTSPITDIEGPDSGVTVLVE